MSAHGLGRKGPLAGVRVIEFAGIGPITHCGMLLADFGADVLRINKPGGNGWPNPVADRGRAQLTLDIRSEAGRLTAREAAGKADVVLEGYRPGVMERLGLGPDDLRAANPRLIYGRMTGWGQTGPLAKVAGHDLNFLAITGALDAIGEPGRSAAPPLNLVGDYGGGSMYFAFGVVSALFERERSGQGQVIDAAIVDGVASLMHLYAGLVPDGRLSLDRKLNMFGGAAAFYRCYTCADGREISIGPLEPQFFAALLERIGAPADFLERQRDPAAWEEQTETLARIFASKTRDEWTAFLEGLDICFAPVLTLDESHQHPHMRARAVYEEVDGIQHPAPAPRLSRTPGEIAPNMDGEALLGAWGVALS